MVPRMLEVSDKTAPRKVAFMFLTAGPLPLADLWEMFFEGHHGFYSIYVHSHPSYVHEMPPTSVFYGRRIPSQVGLIVFFFFFHFLNIGSRQKLLSFFLKW